MHQIESGSGLWGGREAGRQNRPDEIIWPIPGEGGSRGGGQSQMPLELRTAISMNIFKIFAILPILFAIFD